MIPYYPVKVNIYSKKSICNLQESRVDLAVRYVKYCESRIYMFFFEKIRIIFAPVLDKRSGI